MELLCGISLTKDVVLKAVKMAGDLVEAQENYILDDAGNNKEKKDVEFLYVEGDGLFVKSSEADLEHKNIELSHFVVHEGSYHIGGKRFGLMNKKEFISMSYYQAKEKLFNYIYHRYNTQNTVLITNADGGKGYSHYAFLELSKSLCCKEHHHFIDAYHVNQSIDLMYRNYLPELKHCLYKAINTSDKQLLKATLDTTESYIQDEVETSNFKKFAQRIVNQFDYLIPPFLRGFKDKGIGIIESQHRKISYRMKHRGMYWSKRGANTMAKLIIHVYEKTLRELFFGKWLEDYQHSIQDYDFGAGWLLPEITEHSKLHESQLNLKIFFKKVAQRSILV